jgi:hypothetical protein
MAEKRKYRAFEIVSDIARTELRHFTAALRQVQEEAETKQKSESDDAQSNRPNQIRPK